MKKAQSISMQTIIIAVICLVVIVFLLFIFKDKVGKFGKSANQCEMQGGSCGAAGVMGPPYVDGPCGKNEIQINAECSDGAPCCGRLDIEGIS